MEVTSAIFYSLYKSVMEEYGRGLHKCVTPRKQVYCVPFWKLSPKTILIKISLKYNKCYKGDFFKKIKSRIGGLDLSAQRSFPKNEIIKLKVEGMLSRR